MSIPTRNDIAALMPQLKDDLGRLVAIPSISALAYPAETRAALLEAYEEVARLFGEAGVTILDPLELPDTAPVLVGEVPAPDGAPTVLLYSHYDVVPIGDEDKWESPPFEANERVGATLADGGVNPVTGVRVIDEETCRHTLAVMTTAGLYETSGDWLYDVGLPGKSGVGGGIVTVAPGKGGLGTFSPLLDEAGNSVRGQLAAQFLSHAIGLDLFASEAVRVRS